MKRTIFFLLAVMSMMVTKAHYVDKCDIDVISTDGNEIRVLVGVVTIESKTKNLYVLTTPDTLAIKAVIVNPTSHFSREYDFHFKDIVIPYTEENLGRLKAISDKYTEWSKTAIENNVGHMEKDIDISIDDLYVHLYETSGNKVTNEFNISGEKKKFIFCVPATREKEPMLRIILNGKDHKKDSKYFAGSLWFNNYREFDDFVNFIQPENLTDRLKNKTIDKLFK
jgi:hypothetical protein